jgi:hypothetical protein
MAKRKGTLMIVVHLLALLGGILAVPFSIGGLVLAFAETN